MLKTMDSITTKVNQLKATAQELYTSMGIEEFAKDTLDFLTQIMERINSMGKLGKFPAQALATVISLISAIKNVVGMALTGIGKLVNKRQIKINTNINEIKKEFDELVKDRKVKVFYETDKKSYSEAKAKADAIQNGPKKLHLPSSAPVKTTTGQESYYFEYGSGRKRSITKEQYEIGNKASAISDPEQRTKFLKENEASFKGTIALKQIGNGKFSVKAKEVTVEEPKTSRKSTRKKVSTPQQPTEEKSSTAASEKKSFKLTKGTTAYDVAAAGLQVLGSALTLFGASINKTYSEIKTQNSEVEWDKFTMGAGQLTNAAGAFMSGNYLGALTSLFSGIVSLVDSLDWTIDEQLEKLNQEIEESESKSLQSRAEANELDSMLGKYERLKEARYNSAEDYQAFIDFQNELGAKHIELVSYYDAEGNAIIDLNEAYRLLLSQRRQEILDKQDELKLKKEAAELELKTINDKNLVTSNGVYYSRGKYRTDNDTPNSTRKISETFVTEVLGFNTEELKEQPWGTKSKKDFGYKDLIDLNNRLLTMDAENLSDFERKEAVSLLRQGLEALPEQTQEAINWNSFEGSLENAEGNFSAQIEILRDAYSLLEKHMKELGSTVSNYSSYLDTTTTQLAKLNIVEEHSDKLFGRKAIDFAESGLITAIVSSDQYGTLSGGGLTSDNEALVTYFNTLTEEELAAAEEVLLHPERYASAGEQQTALQKVLGDKYNNYAEAFGAFTIDSFSNLMPKKQDFYSFMDGIKLDKFMTHRIPPEFYNGIMNLWGGIQEYVNNGMVDYANHLSAFLNPLFNLASSLGASGNYEGRDELLSILTSLDYSTRDGYDAAIERVRNSTTLSAAEQAEAIGYLEDGMSKLFLNANSAIEAYGAKIEETAEKVKTGIELFTKGSTSFGDIESAFALIQSIDSEALFNDNFIWDASKDAYKLTTEGYRNYQEAVRKSINNTALDAKNAYENTAEALDILLSGRNPDGYIQDYTQDLFNVDSIEDDEIKKILTDWNNQWKSGAYESYDAFIAAKEKELAALGFTAEQYEQIAENFLNDPSELIQGASTYQELVDALELFNDSWILKISNTRSLTNSLLLAGYSLEDISHIREILDNRQQTLYDIMSYGDEITEAQLLEWATSLGIAAEDYSSFSELILNGSDIQTIAEELGIELDTSTQAYVDAYNAWLENTTDTLTDSAIALLEMEEGQMISQEFVDKLRSKYPEMADAILESFSFDNKNGSYKFNGKYLDISNAFLQSGDLDLKNAGQQMVESYMGLISDGLSGSLSYEDASKLIKEFDLDIEADFTKGEKGLSISLGTAHKLYQELVAIDGKLASMAMDSMVEEVEEWYGGNLDVAKTLRLIEETRQKIADAEKKKDTTKKEQYEAELKVLNEIYARREAEDFAFMNRSLGDLENPITFWENFTQATDAMYTASTTGYMGVEEFVNIMSFTQDMMIQTGMDTQKAGIDCQALMLEGLRAMTSVDGKLQIPMASLGADFVEGADGMYANFQDGIQTIAKSQIEMLDAQIAMLEAVVAFEELDDNGNGRLGMGELFVETAEGYAYNEDTKRALEKLREKLGEDNKIYEQIIGEIDGELIYFKDLFNPDKTWTEEQAKYVQEYLNKIMQFYDENGNFDQEGFLKWATDYNQYWIDFKKKIEGLVNEGDTVEIEVNGKKINVTKTEGGYTITDGNTTEGPFASAEEAVGSLYQKYIPEINPEDYTSPSQPPVEMPMEVVISPKLELVYGTPTIEDPTAEDYPYLAEEMKRNPLIGKIYSNKETVIGTQEVPYNLDFNVNVVSENIPDALFTVLETGSGEYDITFKSSEENLALLAGLNDEIEEMSDLVTTPIELISLENLDMANLFIYELIENLKKLGTINPDTKIEPTKTTVSPTTGMTGELPTLADPSSMYDPEEIFSPIKLEFEQTAGEINSDFNLQPSVDNAAKAETAINNFSTKLKGLSFASAIYNVSLFANALAKIPAKQTIDIVVNIQANSSTEEETDSTVSLTQARGTTQRITISTNGASGKGNVALSRGTLMGELGPELVVSNGRYFVVGQNGAEFVNLADDAIVFNHLQTRQLLNNGNTSHGRPVKNERTSVGMAAGNVDGPAKASAKETLAELYKLRAMWQAMLDWSTKDLASMAKPGGSGGGGGGDKSDNTSFITELEKWYNLLRQIAKWEEKITLEQAKRKNMLKGYDYTASLERELSYLKQQQAAHEELATKRREYYEALRKDLNSTVFAEIFTYDEDGLMQYKKGGFEDLSEIIATNADGTPKYKAADQWGMLVDKFGEGRLASFKINDDGSPAENEEQFLENFFAREESWRETMDSAYDALYEEEKAIEETITAQTEIQQEYIDTQLSFEDKLYQALEDKLQAQIDALEDEKEALENASQSYINGLNEALNNEKNMFGKNQSKQETEQLQRRLAILERSGGSQSEINSLREQIDARLQDSYFEAAQEQIDAVQKAADAQIEKLDEQIDIMTDALEHQKENGLLWQEVYKMMAQWTPSQLVDFIEDYTQSMRENSPLQNQEDLKEALKEAEILDGKKRAEEAEKNWNEYSKTLNLDGMTSSEIEKVKQAYVGAAITGGTPGIAATDKLNSLRQQKEEEEDAIAAGRESVATNTSDKKWRGSLMSSGYTQPVFKSKNYNNSNIISTIGTGNAYVIDYDPASGWLTLKFWKDQYGNHVNNEIGYVKRLSSWSKNNLIPHYTSDFNNYLTKFKSGGLIDFTGPAWVDGTKSKPESILSAEDTALLRSRIFSDSEYSLRSAIEALRELRTNWRNVISNEYGGGVSIDNVEINFNSGTISSDYDMRRAADVAFEELRNLARKTTGVSLNRR